MGGGGGEFKAIPIIDGRQRQAETCIANAAAIFVHWHARSLAAETDDSASHVGCIPWRHHDFHRIVRYEVDVFLHRPRLLLTSAQ
jgi:hypothetical protein